MATVAQISANQQNSTHSTGPKTPEGKAAAARNATKHGLSGAFTVLPHEDQEEFDILLACLRDDFKPANEHESFLVEQMAQSRWRLARARRLETAMFETMLLGEVNDADPDRQLAAKLLFGGDRALATIQRYATAAERSYYKAHTELLKSRHLQNEPKTGHQALTTGHCLSQNEPNPTGHWPLNTGHCVPEQSRT